jgi:hypothetical protein
VKDWRLGPLAINRRGVEIASTSSLRIDDPKYWRDRAEEARVKADQDIPPKLNSLQDSAAVILLRFEFSSGLEQHFSNILAVLNKVMRSRGVIKYEGSRDFRPNDALRP